MGVFFFQAEDGIRDYKVTGVQTCALPIYVHAEIVFVAPVGGIDDAAFAEAHRLYVIEAGASRRAAPNGMAPIVDPSTRNRCQRHSFLHQLTCPPSGIPEAIA